MSIKTGGCGENCSLVQDNPRFQSLAPFFGSLRNLIIREFFASEKRTLRRHLFLLLASWIVFPTRADSQLRRLLFPKPELQNSCEANAYDESGFLVYKDVISKETLGIWGRQNHRRKKSSLVLNVLDVCMCVCFFWGRRFVHHRWGCVWVIIGQLQNAAGWSFGCGATGQRSGFHTLLHGYGLARRWSEELLSAHFDHGQGAARVAEWGTWWNYIDQFDGLSICQQTPQDVHVLSSGKTIGRPSKI